MTRWLTAACLATFAIPATAQETRIVTDHAGHEVAVPVHPERIVSLHDWTTTVMIHELGGMLVGSTGRLDEDGGYEVRSGEELYDLGFDDIALASVHGQIDIEEIASLDPDLIVGTAGDIAQYRTQLMQIAPTLLFDPQNGEPALKNYEDFAGWIGRSEAFDAELAAYRARIEALAPRIAPDAPSYVAMTPNPVDGDIRLLRTFGAQTQVLNDLGFEPAAVVDELVPRDAQGIYLSPEIVGRFDADWIFSSYRGDLGESPDTTLADLDRVAPGASDFLSAVPEQFVSHSRLHVYPMTFEAMNYLLDNLTHRLPE